MVDWDRVEELRSRGWDWNRIAADPKVGFHPDTSVQDSGRALRALYHRQRSRQRRQGGETGPAPTPKKVEAEKERRWTLTRIGYLLVPIVGIWFVFAYVLPSPVGVVVPALPYLGLALAVVAILLIFALWRSGQERWSKALRTTVVTGVVVGLVVAGMIALAGALFFGCPILPSASSATAVPGGQGWTQVSASAWQDSGKPVFYFYGATWCPYCSASSWAMWKALSEFQSGFSGGTGGIPGTSFQYSNPSDVYPSTPEVVLGFASVSSTAVSFQVSEYYWTQSTGTAGTFPSTSSCTQQAYVTAYSGNSIPFVVVNGQYVHGGSSLIDPADLSTWSAGNSGGYTTVAQDVLTESTASGSAWPIIDTQAAWICAFVIKGDGYSTVSAFLASPAGTGLSNPGKYQWTTTMTGMVNGDLAQI